MERGYEDYLEGSESVIVKGRLRVNVEFWESIGASQFILSIIKEGYKIPFYYTPTPVILGRPARFQTSNFTGPYNLHRLLLSRLGLLFRSLPIVLLDQS